MNPQIIRTIVLTALLVSPLRLAFAADDLPSRTSSFSAKNFGAVGDGQTKDTNALQKAINAVHDAGGGTVVLSKGTYLTGTLYMKDGVTLYLATGTILLGSTDVEDYPINQCEFPSRTDQYCCRALIWGEGLRDIAIVGRGIIDGQGSHFKDNRISEHARDELINHLKDSTRYRIRPQYINRPFTFRFVSCRNILIEGITLQNSPMWMQHYLNCDFITIRGVTVYNHAAPNNDMIDIDGCRDVVISDCCADTDDDALTLKSTAGRPTENVTITNCILSSHCNTIKAGSESSGGFKNITITNCIIRPSRDTMPILGEPQGLAGIALEIVDGGTLDGVIISNVTIVGQTTPIFLRLGNRAHSFKKDMPKSPVGTFRNVVLNNIIATNTGAMACSITGLPGHPIENVCISNVKIEFKGGGTTQHAVADVPERAAEYPECTMFGMLPAYGFYCRHVEGLTFRDVDLSFTNLDHRPALVCDDVGKLVLDTFNAHMAPDASAQIVFSNTRNAMIRGCSPPPTTAVFLRLQKKCNDITVIGNDLSHVKIPFAYDDTIPLSVVRAIANRNRN